MQAYLYDAVRSPRGKARADGGLATAKPQELVGGLVDALEARGQAPRDADASPQAYRDRWSGAKANRGRRKPRMRRAAVTPLVATPSSQRTPSGPACDNRRTDAGSGRVP